MWAKIAPKNAIVEADRAKEMMFTTRIELVYES